MATSSLAPQVQRGEEVVAPGLIDVAKASGLQVNREDMDSVQAWINQDPIRTFGDNVKSSVARKVRSNVRHAPPLVQCPPLDAFTRGIA